MADHVCDEVASPEIEHGEDGPEHQRNNDVRHSAGPMDGRKNRDRNCRRNKPSAAYGFKPLNRVTAEKQFLHDACANDHQRLEPYGNLVELGGAGPVTVSGKLNDDPRGNATNAGKNA